MNDVITAVPTSNNRPAAAPRARVPWWLWLVLLLVLLVAAAGVGGAVFLWHRMQLADVRQQAKQEAAAVQLVALQKKLEEQIDSDKRFRQQTVNVLKDNSDKLRSLDRIDTSYWRLAEAEFLLKQAHQRLFITHDVATANLLLASADSAIAQQKDPGLLPVRTAIANDRAALRKVKSIDRDGIYLRLQALSTQVGLLTGANRFLQDPDVTASTAEELGYSGQLLARLFSIVRIHHYDQPVEPLLPPQQETYLRQNLQLALSQAQLALIQNQQQTYAASLERAEGWVSQYLQTEDPVVRQWLEELQTLMRIDIAPELPDISGSLRAVEKIIDERANDIQRALLMDDDESSKDKVDATAVPAAAHDIPSADAGGEVR